MDAGRAEAITRTVCVDSQDVFLAPVEVLQVSRIEPGLQRKTRPLERKVRDMKSPFAKSKTNASRRFAIVLIVIGILATVPLLSGAHTPATTNITVVNNSSREIRHLYLSPSNQDNWGPDQLGGSMIGSGGGSYTLSNVACSQTDIKVIAEDHNGCFLYQIVSCGQSSTWTITNDATPDCG